LGPFRAAVVFRFPRPRALPWAVMLRPFGAKSESRPGSEKRELNMGLVRFLLVGAACAGVGVAAGKAVAGESPSAADVRFLDQPLSYWVAQATRADGPESLAQTCQVLAAALDGDNATAKVAAADALVALGPRAEPAVPALVGNLDTLSLGCEYRPWRPFRPSERVRCPDSSKLCVRKMPACRIVSSPCSAPWARCTVSRAGVRRGLAAEERLRAGLARGGPVANRSAQIPAPNKSAPGRS